MAPFGVTPADFNCGFYPVCAEMPNAIAALTPCRQHADTVEETNLERPDHAIRPNTFAINVCDEQLPLIPDGCPKYGEVDCPSRRIRSGSYNQMLIVNSLRKMRWNDTAYAGQRILRRSCQLFVCAFSNPAGPKCKCFNFIFWKHQGWQKESGFEDKPQSGLTIDCRALCTE